MVGEEWDRLEAGTLGDEINPWGSVMFETMVDVEPQSNAEQSAYDRWLDQTNAREQARNDRVHAVSGVIPSPLWIVLLFVSAVIFLYMLFFADSAERATTQALLMGSVVSGISTLLLLLVFFNQPFQDDVGGLRPDSMERVLRIIDESAASIGVEVVTPTPTTRTTWPTSTPVASGTSSSPLRRLAGHRPLRGPRRPALALRHGVVQLEARDQAEELDGAAEASAALVRRNIQRAGNYVLAVVLFAVALFFAGISTKLVSERLRLVLLVVGWIVFLGAVAWIATFPISFAV